MFCHVPPDQVCVWRVLTADRGRCWVYTTSPPSTVCRHCWRRRSVPSDHAQRIYCMLSFLSAACVYVFLFVLFIATLVKKSFTDPYRASLQSASGGWAFPLPSRPAPSWASGRCLQIGSTNIHPALPLVTCFHIPMQCVLPPPCCVAVANLFPGMKSSRKK